MYNLLIVDDELSVVNGLFYDFNWTEMGFSEVFKAYDGGQALEIMKKYRIDLIISDIKMPEIDGLTLTSRIKEQWPLAKVILLSGYDDFKYAKKAIDLNVVSFVTKPAPYNEIINVVSKAIDEIEKDLEGKNVIEEAKRQLVEILPILSERYLNSTIVQGRECDTKSVSKLCELKLDLQIDKPGFLIMVHIDKWKNDHVNIQEGVFELALQNMIKDLLLKGGNCCFFKEPEGKQIVVIQGTDIKHIEETVRYVEGMVENVYGAINNNLGCIVSIFWSEIVPSFGDLHTAYTRMLDKMHKGFIRAQGILMGPGKKVQDTGNDKIQKLFCYPSFLSLVETCQRNESILRIEDIFREIEEKSSFSSDNLLQVYNIVSGALIQDSLKRGIQIALWAQETEKCFYYIEDIKSASKLKSWCLQATEKYISYIMKMEKNQTQYTVEKAKKIMLQLFKDDLSVTELASYLYIHPQYLTRIFKEVEGIPVSEYLIKLRIDRAKEMLRVAGMKVYEIAEYVGYNSIAHFNRIFKREVGITPKEYQANYPQDS